MPNWIGDLVMATPVLRDVRRRFPHAKITAMCSAGLAPLLAHDPDIDELFAFSRPSGWLRRNSRRDVIAPLQAGHYDLGILLTNSLSSAWWFWRGRVRKRLGYRKDGRRVLLSRALSFPDNVESQHLVKTYKGLLEPLGISLSETAPRLHILDEELQAARERLKALGVPEGATIVGVNPGAAYGSAKCWPPESFRETAQRLLEDPNTYVLFFGDANGAPLVKEICGGLSERAINLAGATSLRELVAMIQLCDVFLTNDSGPMHVAAAVKTPLVALFGSTSAIKTGPYGQGTVIHKHVECSPCYKRECPIDFRCMKRIVPDEVYEELTKLLKSGA